MRIKSESFTHFKNFHVFARKHTGEHIRILRTDNGGEYISAAFTEYLQGYGIWHLLTVPYILEQKGVSERSNCTHMDLVRCIILRHNNDNRLWAEALSKAIEIRNGVLFRSVPYIKTPHHLWNGPSLNLSHLRIFVSARWYVLPRPKLQALDSSTESDLMAGYYFNRKV